MARPISWLPRLAAIHRTVAGSPRSHYGRGDFERLFELQPRAAQKLIEQMSSVPIGTSRLVEREALLAFLDSVRDAGHPARVPPRANSNPASKRSLRQLVPHDLPPTSWETLPEALSLAPGEVRISFTRVEELAAALAALASLLDRELEAFADRYEIRPEPAPEQERQDVERMFAELRQMEATRQGV
jgi:hypothetical protein